MLCCNGDAGEPLGKLSALELSPSGNAWDAYLRLEACVIGAEMSVRLEPAGRSPRRLRLGRLSWQILDYRCNVGNFYWDAVRVRDDVAVEAVNHVLAATWRGEWKYSIDHGDADLFDVAASRDLEAAHRVPLTVELLTVPGKLAAAALLVRANRQKAELRRGEGGA